MGTDSSDIYGSRIDEFAEEWGEFGTIDGAGSHQRFLIGVGIDHTHEISYYDQKRVHNLKYYWWVEQQGQTYVEIQAQCCDPDCWTSIHTLVDPIAGLIDAFNGEVGLGT